MSIIDQPSRPRGETAADRLFLLVRKNVWPRNAKEAKLLRQWVLTGSARED